MMRFQPKRSKYGAQKTIIHGETFDSKREASRYQELYTLQMGGRISGLKRQVKYEIIPEHREPDSVGPKGGKKKGKLLERARFYVADFVYFDRETNSVVVEDCKGYRTETYKLKKALMLDRYGIRIKET